MTEDEGYLAGNVKPSDRNGFVKFVLNKPRSVKCDGRFYVFKRVYLTPEHAEKYIVGKKDRIDRRYVRGYTRGRALTRAGYSFNDGKFIKLDERAVSGVQREKGGTTVTDAQLEEIMGELNDKRESDEDLIGGADLISIDPLAEQGNNK